METFSALQAICAGNSPVTDEFPSQRPVTRSFDVLLDLNKRLSKQSSWGWWFETSSRSLWRHCNVLLWLSVRVTVSINVIDIQITLQPWRLLGQLLSNRCTAAWKNQSRSSSDTARMKSCCQLYTVEYRYNAVQYNIVLYTALQRMGDRT